MFAERHGIRVAQTERLRRDPQIYELLKSADPELMVVVAFGQILPKDFFAYPPFGTINVHASLLPRHRGASPIVHAILNGESETGVTIMLIDEGMDTGDMLTSRVVAIGPDTTAGELEATLAEEGARLLVETIPGYVGRSIGPRPQDHSKASHAPRLNKDRGRIDWGRPAGCVHNQIRALNPWPAAFAGFRDQTVKVWRSSTPQADEKAPADKGWQPGEIISAGRDGLWVQCGDGRVLLRELQLPGRNRVSAGDLANGLKIHPGERFE